MTATANSVFTAAQFNTFVRDNLNETAPAKATLPGAHFAATGVNSIAQRRIATDTVLVEESTTSTNYTNLATVGPTVTVTTGVAAIVIIHGQCDNSGAGTSRIGYQTSGATSFDPAFNRSVIFRQNSSGAASTMAFHGPSGDLELNPGVHTFQAKYGVSSGTGTFHHRRIMVIPL